MKHIIISNHETVWDFCNLNKVDYLMIDLEINGKKDRQSSKSTWISDHNLQDIAKAKSYLRFSKVLVRINPIHNRSLEEINEVLNEKPDAIMLPYFSKISEVELFFEYVDKRAKVILLFETLAALEMTEEIFIRFKVDYAFVGLNDLSIDMNIPFLFDIFQTDLIDNFSRIANKHNVIFGFGGIGHGEKLEISPKLIYAQHVRLGSELVILSRNFIADLYLNNSNSTFVISERFKSLLKIESDLNLSSKDTILKLTREFMNKLGDRL